MDALFAFDDPAAAHRVRDRLLGLGWAEKDVAMHGDATRPLGREIADADEMLVSGGLLRNIQHLLEGVFDGDAVEQDASPFTETLQRGGAVLRVHAATPTLQATVDDAVREAGCTRRTGWK